MCFLFHEILKGAIGSSSTELYYKIKPFALPAQCAGQNTFSEESRTLRGEWVAKVF